jgi:Arm DNA-binding domain
MGAEMGVITDKQLQSRAGATDTWLIEDGPRGAGRFVARITPAGERLFYYRYTDSKGVRVRLPIGSFDPKGTSGLTLKAARSRADQFAKIYLSGQKDLREFLEPKPRKPEHVEMKSKPKRLLNWRSSVA